MPVGVITNALSIFFGGILGVFAGHKLSAELKEKLTMVFGCCSLGIGISSIPFMSYMPAVIFSVIAGTAIGVTLRLDSRIRKGAALLQKPVAALFHGPSGGSQDSGYMDSLITVIVLFCASSTGIYGTIVSGITGDHSILISKSILDLFTAAIFACNLGIVVSAIAVPQFILFMFLFFLSRLIFPLTSPEMINDFKACGGILLIATGFRISKVKDFPVADMIPAMVIVMPISWAWAHLILPLL